MRWIWYLLSSIFRHQQHILNDKSNNLKQFKGNLIQTAPEAFRVFFMSAQN